MKQTPLVSIVLPTYNRQNMLLQALESCVTQTYRPIEIIVVDDGSTDGTDSRKEKAIIDGSRNDVEIIWIRQENRGVAAARNTGIRHSTGKYLLFHDSDDILDKDKVRLQVEMLEYLGADVCASSQNKIDSNMNVISSYIPAARPNVILSDLEVKRIHWGTQIFTYKRAILENLWQDETLSSGEDAEYAFRVFQQKLKICFEPRAITYKRIHDDSRLSVIDQKKETTYLHIHEKMLKYYRKTGNKALIVEEQRKLLGRVYSLYASGQKEAAINLFRIIKPFQINNSISLLEAPVLLLGNIYLFYFTRKMNEIIGRFISR